MSATESMDSCLSDGTTGGSPCADNFFLTECRRGIGCGVASRKRILIFLRRGRAFATMLLSNEHGCVINLFCRFDFAFARLAFIRARCRIFFTLPAAFLNATEQFSFFSFGKFQGVRRQSCDFLLQFSSDDVPVSFGSECGHNFFCFAAIGGRMILLLQLTCRREEEKLAVNFNNSCAPDFNALTLSANCTAPPWRVCKLR